VLPRGGCLFCLRGGLYKVSLVSGSLKSLKTLRQTCWLGYNPLVFKTNPTNHLAINRQACDFQAALIF